MPRLCSSLLLSLLIGSSASAVTTDWKWISSPGNPSDPPGFGAVGYEYSLGAYEVTNAQYVEFLNAMAASDPLGLYNTSMGFSEFGGITRTGSSGTYSYNPITGRENMPVNFVSVYDAMRFANWLNNGQGNGSTETGAYTLLGNTAAPSNGSTVTRNPGAVIVLPTENEWYKAAYYDPASSSYFDYPTGTDTQPVCSAPTATANRANCDNAVGDLTIRGSYTGSASRYGTFDQGGNVWEWTESFIGGSGPGRVMKGGGFTYLAADLASSTRRNSGSSGIYDIGFRLAMIPEPGTGLLVLVGLLGFGVRRRIGA